MSRGNKPSGKDMYWFAHGGAESDKNLVRNPADGDEDLHHSNSPTWNTLVERKGSPEVALGYPHIVVDGSGSSGPPSLEKEDRLRAFDKRLAVEERKKLMWEAEQERNDAALKKRMEREAAFEARRNAQRSNISFAFGSSVPRNVEILHVNEGDSDIMSRSFTADGLSQKEENHDTFHDRRSVSPLNYSGHNSLVDDFYHQPISSQFCTYSERKIMHPSSWLTGSGALIGEDFMSRSMSSAISPAPRGRRKNDLMPTVPYERNPTPRAATSSSNRKRSVSMTRLDQLAQPRRHYVEANKANSTASSGASSTLKDVKSPTRPLSSASENSGGSGRVPGTVTRRVRSSPRKPRPFSIAGTIPDLKPVSNAKPFEVKVSPVKRSYTPTKRVTDANEVRKTGGLSSVKSSTPKSTEKAKPAPRPASAAKPSTPKSTTPKPTPPKPKTSENKQPAAKSASVPKTSTTPKVKEKTQPIKKKVDAVVSSPLAETKEKTSSVEKVRESPSPPLDSEVLAENEKNNAKRIISEEEARAALAEKRRLAREQAEREAELERQRQEELRRQEEERIRQEEEEHRKMEEEQIRLLEEHRRQEEEKLRKAIEDQEQKEEEERARRDEEIRLKAEQEKKAKEEAEKQRLELEEKLRKEEEERAERKKRLEKIMSRTRGKSSGTSPSGSVSGSDQLDSGENPHEGFSSGANSLDSNETGEPPSEPVSIDDNMTKAEISSTGDSMENNPTYEIGSENESLNSNDLMMPMNETASQDNSLVIIPDKVEQKEETVVTAAVDASSPVLSSETKDEVAEAASNPSLSQNETSGSTSTEIAEPSFSSSNVEETSADAVSSDAQVPTTVLSESAEMLPVESHSFKNDVEVGSPSFDSSVQNSGIENKELVNQLSPQSLENEQFFVHKDSAESDMLKESEFPKVDEIQQNVESSEMNMPFNDDTVCEVSFEKSNQDAVLSQPNNFTVDHSQFETSSPSGIDLDYPVETEFSEMNRSSISSDIKLPDPIYETSDDGSVSSEKQLQEFKSAGNHEEFGFGKSANVVDDVFSEPAAPSNPELNPQNPFGEEAYLGQSNPFGLADNAQRSELDNMNEFQHQFGESHQYNMSESMFEEKETFILPDVLEQPHELDGGNVLPSEYSAVVEQENSEVTQQLTVDAFESQFSNFTNVEGNSQMNPFSESKGADAFMDQFSNVAPEAYASSDNGNMLSATAPFTSTEILQSESSNLAAAGDNPFVGKSFTDASIFHNLETQGGDSSDVQLCVTIQSEQVGLEGQLSTGGDILSESEKLSDVTFIKDDGSGACVGIISSVDHDHVSNDFPKKLLHSEHLKNNFECASMTESEDSSLDSNLSQVMTVENSEKDTIGGLNHIENSILESNSSNLVSGNGEQHDNPFATDHIYNNGSISKSNGSSFSASQVYSNGHGLESSKPEQVDELHDYLQLDGNDISSVDHSKNNMYENVDAIEYSKVSSDPFLAKGNSKQISGNPFLLQDDQKQVLMSPDFLN